MTVLHIEKGQLKISTEPFKVKRELYRLRGSFAELTTAEMVAKYGDCYLHVTLTDEEEILNVLGDMRQLYPRLCYLTFDNSRTRHREAEVSLSAEKQPLELVCDFFQQRSGHELKEVQKNFLENLLENLQEEK